MNSELAELFRNKEIKLHMRGAVSGQTRVKVINKINWHKWTRFIETKWGTISDRHIFILYCVPSFLLFLLFYLLLFMLPYSFPVLFI